MKAIINESTGIESLDRVINNLNLGDNVVWQVDSIEDYKSFAEPFAKHALDKGRNLHIMRFANHPLLIEDERATVHELDANSGFETFSKEVYRIITEAGEEAFYVFDCLSDLLPAWATDLMIGNFFVNTCPYLFELNTIAYFALIRNDHNFKTIARIRETTQLMIDVYNINNNHYIHPIKVENRYSPTMFFPHRRMDESFIPINSTDEATRFINFIQRKGTESTKRILDFWDRLFLEAEELALASNNQRKKNEMIDRICHVMIAKDERILNLVKKQFSLEDLILIKDRLIGTGYIGGKATGMLLARKILANDKSYKWNDLLEYHDSYYIGSDVFYTYIVQNGLWKLYMEQKNEDKYFSAGQNLKEELLQGKFPDELREQFQEMIDYFGQSPIIVRSSSLLEDGFGNAFAGKYESHFLVNRGTPAERYMKFTEAVRRVYASTMNENALEYRKQRGLDQMEEQMGLLVMRVSGSHHNEYFFPDIGGVGLSYNTYVWDPSIDPSSGMLRLVFGLGTRAVERVEGDYPRIVALSDPLTQPLAGMDDRRRFSQHKMDLLDFEKNDINTIEISDLLSQQNCISLNILAEQDFDAKRKLEAMGIKDRDPWIFSFERLFREKEFSNQMMNMMNTLENFYDYPVDIEFTVNFTPDENYRINLLQCRPHQGRGDQKQVTVPDDIPEDAIYFRTHGNFLGGSISKTINMIIYIDPESYSDLSMSDKYETARIIGHINRQLRSKENFTTALIGPGRWGTTTPSLGVPVGFAEISNISILVELARMHENLMPELSFGSHFFLDLVETDVFYAAVFPGKTDVLFNEDFTGSMKNIFSEDYPEYKRFQDTVKVFKTGDNRIEILSDIISQKMVCYQKEPAV